MSALFGLLICVFLIGFIGPVYGALTDNCTDTSDCDGANNEVCDITDAANVCVCNTNYTAGISNDTVCFQDCPDDPMFDHGSRAGDKHYEGSASITCDSGYTTGGGLITCKNDGTWDTSTATACNAVDCTNTINDANGAHSGNTTFGGSASIVCNTGYTGGGTIVCQNDTQWDYSGATTCSLVDCGNPSVQAGYSAGAGGTTYQSTRNVTCDTDNGYSGSPSVITCQALGSWTAYSGCTTGGGGTVDCTTTISDANGAHSGDTTFGGSASIVCNTGYTGGGTIVCQADANWNETGAATCAIVDCGNPSPPTGYSAASGGATTYGSNKTVTCDAGSGYTGSPPVITCEASGNWTAFSDCSTGGGTVDCGSSISDGNGALRGETTPGGTASIACNTGYTGGGSIICEDDGIWNETGATTCTLVDCEDPRPEDGYVPQNPSTTTYQSTADVDCASGFNGTASQITCEANGEWSAYEGCSTGHRMIIDLSLVTVVVAVWLVLVAEAH